MSFSVKYTLVHFIEMKIDLDIAFKPSIYCSNSLGSLSLFSFLLCLQMCSVFIHHYSCPVSQKVFSIP